MRITIEPTPDHGDSHHKLPKVTVEYPNNAQVNPHDVFTAVRTMLEAWTFDRNVLINDFHDDEHCPFNT